MICRCFQCRGGSRGVQVLTNLAGFPRLGVFAKGRPSRAWGVRAPKRFHRPGAERDGAPSGSTVFFMASASPSTSSLINSLVIAVIIVYLHRQ